MRKNNYRLTQGLLLGVLLCLLACDRSSSPEGRSKLRDEQLGQAIEQLKNQQNVILDSIQSLNRQLQKLKQDQKNERN